LTLQILPLSVTIKAQQLSFKCYVLKCFSSYKGFYTMNKDTSKDQSKDPDSNLSAFLIEAAKWAAVLIFLLYWTAEKS